jgi:hypothetical protein
LARMLNLLVLMRGCWKIVKGLIALLIYEASWRKKRLGFNCIGLSFRGRILDVFEFYKTFKIVWSEYFNRSL